MKGSRLLIPLLFAALLCGCDTDARDWKSASESDSETAYTTYLDAHPEGQHIAEAKARIHSLQAAAAWQAATASNTLQGYRSYVENFGDTSEAATARARIADLERSAAWDTARRDGSETALNAFVQHYPNSDEADQARAMVEQIETQRRLAKAEETARKAREAAEQSAREAEARKTSRVQLASFGSREAATKGAQRLEKALGDLLSAPLVVQAPEEYGSTHYFRVVTAPLEPEAARSTCERMREAKHDCFVVNR